MSSYRPPTEVSPLDKAVTQMAGFLLSVSAAKVSASNRKERITPQIVEAFGQIIDMVSESVVVGAYNTARTRASAQAEGHPPRDELVILSDADMKRYIEQYFIPSAGGEKPGPSSSEG